MPRLDLFFDGREWPFSVAPLVFGDAHIFLFHSAMPPKALDQLFVKTIRSSFSTQEAAFLYGSLIVGSYPPLLVGEAPRSINIQHHESFNFLEYQYPITASKQGMWDLREEKSLKVMLKNFQPKSTFEIQIKRLAHDLIYHEKSSLRHMFLHELEQAVHAAPGQDYSDDLREVWIPIMTTLIYRQPITFVVKPRSVSMGALWRAFHVTKIYLACAGLGEQFIWQCRQSHAPRRSIAARRSVRSTSIVPISSLEQKTSVMRSALSEQDVLRIVSPFISVDWNDSERTYAFNGEFRVLLALIARIDRLEEGSVTDLLRRRFNLDISAGLRAAQREVAPENTTSFEFFDLIQLKFVDLAEISMREKLRDLSMSAFGNIFSPAESALPLTFEHHLHRLFKAWLEVFRAGSGNQNHFIMYLTAVIDGLYCGRPAMHAHISAEEAKVVDERDEYSYQLSLHWLLLNYFASSESSIESFKKLHGYINHFKTWLTHTFVLSEQHVLKHFLDAWDTVVQESSIQWFLKYKYLLYPAVFQQDGYLLSRSASSSIYWPALRDYFDVDFLCVCASSRSIVTLFHSVNAAMEIDRITFDSVLEDLVHMAFEQSHFDRAKEVFIVWCLVAAQVYVEPNKFFAYMSELVRTAKLSIDQIVLVRSLIEGALQNHATLLQGDEEQQALASPLYTDFFVFFLRQIVGMDMAKFGGIKPMRRTDAILYFEGYESFNLTDWSLVFAYLQQPRTGSLAMAGEEASVMIFQDAPEISPRVPRMPLCSDKFVFNMFAMLASNKHNSPINHVAKCVVHSALGVFFVGLIVPAQIQPGSAGNITAQVYPQIFYQDDINQLLTFFPIVLAKDIVMFAVARLTKSRMNAGMHIYHIVDVAFGLCALIAGSDLAFFEEPTLLNDALFYYGELYFSLAFFRYHSRISDALAKALGFFTVAIMEKVCCKQRARHTGHDLQHDHFVARLHQINYHTLFYASDTIISSLAVFAALNPFANLIHDMGNNFPQWLSRFIIKLSGNTISVVVSPALAIGVGLYHFATSLRRRYSLSPNQWLAVAGAMLPSVGMVPLKASQVVGPAIEAVAEHRNISSEVAQAASSALQAAVSTAPPVVNNQTDSVFDSNLLVWLFFLAAIVALAALVVVFEKLISLFLPRAVYPKTTPVLCGQAKGPRKTHGQHQHEHSQYLLTGRQTSYTRTDEVQLQSGAGDANAPDAREAFGETRVFKPTYG